MNIDNNKISGRQLGRLVFYDFFALTTLLLPGILAKTAGMDGFFALAAGGAAGYVLLFLVSVQIGRMRLAGQDYFTYLRTCFGKLLTAVILVVYLLAALFGAAYGLRLLCDITRQYLIRDTPAWLVLAVLAALAVYGLYTGLEGRGRMYEIMFWFVLLPFFFLFFLAAHNVEPDRWAPVFCAEAPQILKSGYLVFAFLSGSVFFPMLSEGVFEHADMTRVLKQGFLFSICVNLTLFLLLTGIFGTQTVATMKEAVLTMTAMVKVPGGFLERQDALLCGIWLVSIFAFAENALYYAVWCMKSLGGKRARGWFLPAAAAFVYVLALCMYRSGRFASLFSRIYVKVMMPALVGIVLVACILSKIKYKNRQKKDIASTSANRADSYDQKTARKEEK